MEKRPVYIDFNVLKNALREHVRKKVMAAGISIFYVEKGEAIKGNKRSFDH